MHSGRPDEPSVESSFSEEPECAFGSLGVGDFTVEHHVHTISAELLYKADDFPALCFRHPVGHVGEDEGWDAETVEVMT